MNENETVDKIKPKNSKFIYFLVAFFVILFFSLMTALSVIAHKYLKNAGSVFDKVGLEPYGAQEQVGSTQPARIIQTTKPSPK
ncbi:MAG: hypothetical protein WC243_04030, partial [Patescibacteria group bacterium]